VKILYLITKSNWGGAQRHVFDLAVAAKKNGQEVVVALGGEGVLRDRLREAGIPTRSVQEMWRDISLVKDFTSLIKIFKIIRAERPDILHVHSPKAAGLGSFVARLLGIKKIIYTVHGFAFNEDRPYYQKVAIVFFSWLTLLFSTHIVLLYEKEKRQTDLFPGVAHKLRIISQGINPPTFYAAASARQLLQKNTTIPLDKKTIVGTIGELHPSKGYIYAINAIEKLKSHLPNVLFYIIGEGEQRKYLESLIKEKKLEEYVVLAGTIPHAAEYLRAFSIFLMSSIKEAFPYVILEAGTAGLPVIATTVGALPEVITDMESGILIQSKKSDEVFHSLLFLLEHKNAQREYARNLQEKVKREYSLERMITATMRLYAEPPRKVEPQSKPQ
jgi:glycosyltransferase involved in cell wall biosynthesis